MIPASKAGIVMEKRYYKLETFFERDMTVVAQFPKSHFYSRYYNNLPNIFCLRSLHPA